MLNSTNPICIVVSSDGARHTLAYYLGCTSHTQCTPFLYEYTCHRNAPNLWIAVTAASLSSSASFLPIVLQETARRRLNVHNYSGQGTIMGPGAFQTLQSWLGSVQAVRQRFDEETLWVLQRMIPSPMEITTSTITEDTELEWVLARSLDDQQQQQRSGRQSPAPAWMNSLASWKSEPARPGIDPRCVVCMDSRASVAFVDCGHQIVCDECVCIYWSHHSGNKRQCLVCRKPIQHAPIHLIPSEPAPVNKDHAMV